MIPLRRVADVSLRALLLAALCSCGDAVVAPPLYRAAVVTMRDISIAVEASGVLEPATTVEVKSKASGEVLELNVGTGQLIPASVLMVRID